MDALTHPHQFPGKLIIVEGIDGSGKSTQLQLAKRYLEAKGLKPFFTEWNSADLVKAITKEGKKKKEKGGEKKGEGEKLAGTMKEGPDGVVFYTMPDLSANMQTQDGRPSFLKLKVTFELPNEDAVETLESNMPRLQDMFLTFMRELRHEDVAGSQGNYTLRLEIQRRVNMVIAPQKVNAVLIEEMLET